MIDNDFFFASVRASLFNGSMTQSQVDGCHAILNAWDKWVPHSRNEFIAYSLATCYHETMQAMQPVREIGEGRGHAYGWKVGLWHNVYFGRGDVQLTWQANYAHVSHLLKILNILGPDQDLSKSPDLMLDPTIAAATLVEGMTHGWFTGKKLSDYFSDTVTDWLNARRIVNGMDKAGVVAGYGKKFFAAIRSAP